MNDLPVNAVPSFGLPKFSVNPADKNRRKRQLSSQERNAFIGICAVSAEQFLDCYKQVDEYFSPATLYERCAHCPYRQRSRCSHFARYERSHLEPYFILEMDEYEEDKPGCFVYFVSDGVYVKIGVAKDPLKRLGDLQVANPLELCILCQIPCKNDKSAHSMEKKLHHEYRKRHIRGEWFDLLHYVEMDLFRSQFDPKWFTEEEGGTT